MFFIVSVKPSRVSRNIARKESAAENRRYRRRGYDGRFRIHWFDCRRCFRICALQAHTRNLNRANVNASSSADADPQQAVPQQRAFKGTMRVFFSEMVQYSVTRSMAIRPNGSSSAAINLSSSLR